MSRPSGLPVRLFRNEWGLVVRRLMGQVDSWDNDEAKLAAAKIVEQMPHVHTARTKRRLHGKNDQSAAR